MIPYIDKKKGCLMVHDEPYLMFAGEIHNSNASTRKIFQQTLEKIDSLPVNTLLIPISWELFEPQEGVFDTSLITDILHLLREKQKKAIFLWFGLWKNGLSTYVPIWMKEDRVRFPFAKKKDQTSIYSITPLCKEAIEKDAYAFSKLLSYLKQMDEKEQTVVMVQVENEVGLLHSKKDNSNLAQACFEKEIPLQMQEWSGRKGTWKEVFQEDSEEIFMAYHYASALETITKAGKQVYALPMMINVWLKKEGELAGKYPSGGAVASLLPLYRFLAPSIDVIAPDIYCTEFKEVCDAYGKWPFMIPETRQDRPSISQCIYAFTAYPLLGYAPFGIEDFEETEATNSMYHFLSSLGIERSAFNPGGSFVYLRKIYEDLAAMQKMLLTCREKHMLYPFYRKQDVKRDRVQIEDIRVDITYLNKQEQMKGTGCIFVCESDWFIYGTSFFLSFSHEQKQVGTLLLEEGYFDKQGNWCVTRRLNGDEQYGVYAMEMPSCYRLKLHIY